MILSGRRRRLDLIGKLPMSKWKLTTQKKTVWKLLREIFFGMVSPVRVSDLTNWIRLKCVLGWLEVNRTSVPILLMRIQIAFTISTNWKICLQSIVGKPIVWTNHWCNEFRNINWKTWHKHYDLLQQKN